MDEKGIIIADKDARYRSQMAAFFEKAGYKVETTDSAVHVLCKILEKQTPVLLLGSDFDQKVSSADLIRLLKKANRNLHVIMVSDEMPLHQARAIRQEGIFYHVLKPAGPGDTHEIGQAVECAFEKRESAGEAEHEELMLKLRARGEEAEEPAAPEEPEKGRVLPHLVALAVLILGASVLSYIAAQSATDGKSIAIWVFLGFAALIIVSQFLQIFRIKLRERHQVSQLAREPVDPFDRE